MIFKELNHVTQQTIKHNCCMLFHIRKDLFHLFIQDIYMIGA